MKRFDKVLITGATSGIGEALAKRFLEQGSQVIICGRNEEKLNAFSSQFKNAIPMAFDITNYERTVSSLKESLSRINGVDLAILNAGDHQPTDAADFDAQTYAKLINVNCIGAINCLEPIIADMKSRRSGTIAIMGSVAGYGGLTYAGAYCASKSALMRIAETCRVELASCNIDVKLISPGFVKTPLTDKNDFEMPFLMETATAADRIITGLANRRFETSFPKRLSWPLKLLSALPHFLYFKALRSMLKKNGD